MEDLMPIRIRCCGKEYQEAQVPDSHGLIVVLFAVSAAAYTGRKLVFRVLCGSIESLLGSLKSSAKRGRPWNEG